LENEVQWSLILKLCDDLKMREILHKEFMKLDTAELRWKLLKLRFDEYERENVGHDQKLPSAPSEAAKNFLKIFVLSYTYPKIDEKVTTGLNHLLKSPFSIHPKTGNVAIPLSAKTIDRFQFDQVPRVDKLCTEMYKINKSVTDGLADKENRRQMYYNQSSLAPYIEVFRTFIDGMSK